MTIRFQHAEQQYLFQMLQSVGDKSEKSYVIIDEKFSVLYCNDEYTQLTGFTIEDLRQHDFSSLLINQKSVRYNIEIRRSLAAGKVTTAQLVHKRKNGVSFYAEIENIPFQNAEGQTIFILSFVKDVTQAQLLEFVNRLDQEMYVAIKEGRTFLEKMKRICDGIDSMFHQPSVTNVVLLENEQVKVIQPSKISDQEMTVLLNEQDIKYFGAMIKENKLIRLSTIEQTPIFRLNQDRAIKLNLKTAVCIPIKQIDRTNIGLVTIMFSEHYEGENVFIRFFEKLADVISLIHAYEINQQKVYELAYYDNYIGIVNRHGFIQEMMQLHAEQSEGMIVILEPGEFSRVVELYGRDVGEELLNQLYRRLVLVEKEQEKYFLVGRFSSSSLIMYYQCSQDEMMQIVEELKELVQQPFSIFHKRMYVTLKSGVAFLSKDWLLEESIRYAERALTKAKNYSGTHTSYYVQQNDEELEREIVILNHLNDAIRNREFVAYMQPKVELYRGRIASMEVLARWISPKLGFVSPADFIPIAERAGLIREIDLQIIEQVLQWFQQRQYAGKRIVPVAINISPEHFYHAQFVNDLVSLVQKYYADPHFLIIEITESIGLVDIERAREIIHQLWLKGFKTSVDDFGIGYSSLSYLQKLMFSELKIDRSFTMRIDEIGTNAIVSAIIRIANALEMTVVAEGIEEKWQEEILKSLGCDAAQGFLYYKPMSFEEIEKLQL